MGIWVVRKKMRKTVSCLDFPPSSGLTATFSPDSGEKGVFKVGHLAPDDWNAAFFWFFRWLLAN